jgi:ADP-ribose pyrophosphatase YjhB (NUDIX family)
MTKIPENAKLVFKGKIFDVYHWQQEMFDGSFETFEGIKRKPSVQIIAITPENKIILLKEEQPFVGKFISVPGGQVEDEETPQENAIKELLEETGMKADELILWKEQQFNSKIEWTTYYYIAKGCKKVQDAEPENGEKIIPYEVSFDEFIKESQRKDFRNKRLKEDIFRMMHISGELEKFKKILFN